MKILCIALGVVIIAIAIAFIYEIKHTYRDGDLWKKMNESSAFMRLLKSYIYDRQCFYYYPL